MSFDYGSMKFHTKLREAFDSSREKLKPFRESRIRAVKEYVGSNYGNSGGGRRVVANMIELAVNVYSFVLDSYVSKCSVSTRINEWKSTAYSLELALEYFNKTIEFNAELGRVIKDALFGIGIAKVGLDERKSVTIAGEEIPQYQPFFESVDFDDFVIDMMATRADRASFIGNRYRIPVRKAKKLATMNKALVRPAENTLAEDGEDKVAKIGRGDTDNVQEIEDYINLWDIWFPEHRAVVTYPEQSGGELGLPIKIVEDWYGPDCGPYLLLGIYDVPSAIMPLNAISNLIDAGVLINRLFAKLGRQGERQKKITGVLAGGAKEANAIIRAQDGEVVRLDDPDKVKEFSVGGIDQPTFAYAIQMKQLFSYLGGNLDALGGLAPQSDTIGQDQIIRENSSIRVSYMAKRVTDFVAKAQRAIAWYLFYDPMINIPIIKRVPGTNYEVQTALTPEVIQGEFLDYNFDLSPFSDANKSPSQKLSALTNLWERIIMPLIAELQSFGVEPDIEGFLRLYARYTDMDELNDVVKFTAPTRPEEKAVSSSSSPVKPKNSTRVYDRVHNDRMTQAGQEQVLANTMAGGNPQESQMMKMAASI